MITAPPNENGCGDHSPDIHRPAATTSTATNAPQACSSWRFMPSPRRQRDSERLTGVPSTGCRDAFPKVFTKGILP